MPQISILGCGWLGMPLAKKLMIEGHTINGSTTTAEKLYTLNKVGIKPFLIEVQNDYVTDNVVDFLQNSELLIIDIPPKLGRSQQDKVALNEKSFVLKIKQLIPYINSSKIKNVLFISSTSVYGDQDGVLTEEAAVKPKTESAVQMLMVENLLQDQLTFLTTIVRCGGLIGPNRHPAHFLAAKTNLENPDSPVNLIHLDDVIQTITKIIATNKWGVVFNAVAPFHPSRKDYYTAKAKELHLAIPEFQSVQTEAIRVISGAKTEKELKLKFDKENYI